MSKDKQISIFADSGGNYACYSSLALNANFTILQSYWTYWIHLYSKTQILDKYE